MQDPSARTSRGYLGNIPPVSIFKATPASVLSRFLAWIIDLIVIFIVVLFLFLVFDYSNDPPSLSNTGEADNETGALFLVALSYFVLAGRLTGKTIGKKMMGIKVVNKYDGELLSIWQSIG